ncbi:hypothetical protein [Butyrivibrio sp. WCD3002]|uniref:hypothetical protein n=1 Tax=Butyrivibrio sp. WCD3002 TaxID=1280676 RepID=UPI00040D402D|nr:hypothetical protein [Butyrivibrio sp. WCD3002]
MSGNNYPLNMEQIKADLFVAKATIDEAKRRTPKAAKYLKGQAGYHLQQAAEKLIKIQIYYLEQQPDLKRMYKHSLNELIQYAKSLGISIVVPQYIDEKSLLITSWEAEGRYDVHMIVKITQLEKTFSEIEQWYEILKKNGYK